ncbi:hypothetical protein FQZ97_927280 [compost metagenome]
MPGGHKLTLLTKERRVINGEQHVHGGLINGDPRQCLRVFGVSYRISDLEIFKAGNGTNLAGRHRFCFYFPKAFKNVKFFDFHFFDAAVCLAKGHLLTFFHCTSCHSSDGNTAYKSVIVK